ncbi:alpha/beta hydrolase-fold protein [Neorhizobium sp. NCHU2750]|uniref:alpha/beta hydrolase n=1 Tax=Neorhizobium sp. NCHU2750 TaxID=1825976 RepID=UPI000EB77760|nr:S-formylglutathione hydrolase [Neorhizobium sp. NCHU2750]
MDALKNAMPDGVTLCLPGATAFDLAPEKGGPAYRIFVSVPDGDAPPSGFPVIYVLDGNADFVTVSETVRRVTRRPAATGIHPAIVVGIGYPNTASYDAERRYFDFTLKAPAGGQDHDAGLAYGGQAAFIDFLTRCLMPRIERRFAADPTRRMLLGHSLAGYFALEVAARCPGLFSGYACFSPSIWWDREGLGQRLDEGGLMTASSRLYLAAGRYEQETAPWQAAHAASEDYLAVRESRRMVDNARDLAARLTATFADEERIRFELGEQEDHATILPSLLCRALRFLQSS